jgi:hypothetical protein
LPLPIAQWTSHQSVADQKRERERERERESERERDLERIEFDTDDRRHSTIRLKER